MHPVARALALSIGPAVGIGLARFGYLAGALVTAPVARSFGVAGIAGAVALIAGGADMAAVVRALEARTGA